jgi:hypothetical protein
MRRINFPRQLMEIFGSLSLAHLAGPTSETEPHSSPRAHADHEEGDSPAWWSAWIDLGGEG